MTSASPIWISRAASPIACAPVEQAVTTAWFGPCRPKRIEIWPLARLMSADGMKNGLTRRGPPFSRMSVVSAMALSPPMPEPIMTPARSRSSSFAGSKPESRIAWVAAPMPKTMNSSFRRSSFGSM